MPQFAAHLGYQFTDSPLPERFARAAEAGYRAVEHPVPYSHPPEQWAQWLALHGQRMVQFALPMGGTGEKGIGCHLGRDDEFQAAIDKAVAYARALACTRIHPMAGIVPAGVSRDEAWKVYVARLRYVADALAPHGITVIVEAINAGDVPGYLLDRPSVALAAIDEAGRGNVRFLLDTYHAAVTGESALDIVAMRPQAIGHVQVADHPGRHEPGTGTLPFARFFEALDASGYDGWVGCEYVPQARTEDGLGWMASFGRESEKQLREAGPRAR